MHQSVHWFEPSQAHSFAGFALYRRDGGTTALKLGKFAQDTRLSDVVRSLRPIELLMATLGR